MCVCVNYRKQVLDEVGAETGDITHFVYLHQCMCVYLNQCMCCRQQVVDEVGAETGGETGDITHFVCVFTPVCMLQATSGG